MVQHGEDSLGAHEGEIIDEELAELERQVREEEAKEAEQDEPTRDQLIATGELEPGDVDEIEGEGKEDIGNEGAHEDASIGINLPAVVTDKNLSIRKQIEQGLTGGMSVEELVKAGFNKRSIQTVASELRSKIKVNKAGRGPVASTKSGMPAFAKGTPPELIIDSINVPDVTDGQGVAFEDGIKFGMSLLVLSTRLMQELSIIGVTQTKPLIDMAKSMREGEAVAAKNAAGEAAMEAAGMVGEQFKPYFGMISSLTKKDSAVTAVAKNPMEAMLFNTMQPIIQGIMGKAVSNLTGLPPASTSPQLTEGWTRKEE